MNVVLQSALDQIITEVQCFIMVTKALIE